eukprot:SAG31_NODE_1740_length_7394_cov_7.518849_10_plen_451_part_00
MPTAAATTLGRAAWTLYEQLKILSQDLRGFGIQCSKLESCPSERSNNSATVCHNGAEIHSHFNRTVPRTTIHASLEASSIANPVDFCIEESNGLSKLELSSHCTGMPTLHKTDQSYIGGEDKGLRCSQLDSALGLACRNVVMPELEVRNNRFGEHLGSRAATSPNNEAVCTARHRSKLTSADVCNRSLPSRDSSLNSQFMATSRTIAHRRISVNLPVDRAPKRRRPAQQQTLSRSWGDATKWIQLQQLARTPTFAFLAEMSKEEQLQLYHDLDLKRQLQKQEQSFAAKVVAKPPQVESTSRSTTAWQRHEKSGHDRQERYLGINAGVGHLADRACQHAEAAMNDRPRIVTLHSVSTLNNRKCIDLVAREPFAVTCAVFARVIREYPPTTAVVDVLSVVLWQLCTDGQLQVRMLCTSCAYTVFCSWLSFCFSLRCFVDNGTRFICLHPATM